MWTDVTASQKKNKAKTTMHQKKFVPTCAFCKQLGKEYHGHMMRNNDGVIVCPILLNNECRYCHEKGHTPKYCPVLQNKQKNAVPYTKNYKNDELQESEVQTNPIFKNKMWVTAVMKETINMNTLNPPEETVRAYKATLQAETPPVETSAPVIKKRKPRPKLWSEWESDEEYYDGFDNDEE